MRRRRARPFFSSQVQCIDVGLGSCMLLASGLEFVVRTLKKDIDEFITLLTSSRVLRKQKKNVAA